MLITRLFCAVCCVLPQVRLGEKEALDSLLGFFEGRAAELSSLEYYQERRLKRLGLMDEEGKTTYDSFFKDGIA
jgi:[ribulose-bisphosphate carboxylase]-lysine N-methyltransferase